MDIYDRLNRLAKSIAGKHADDLERLFGEGKTRLEEALDEWEKKLNISWEEPNYRHQSEQSSDSYQKGSPAGQEPYNARQRQYLEDLTTFGLTPPVSLSAIKKARNQELKKYHADRFNNDQKKKKIAEEIMLIYNEAFERLEKYHEDNQLG